MTIYQIESVTIPMGDSVSMQFEFVNSDGQVPDFSDYNAYYVLSPYGFENENALSKQMTISSGTTNVFRVSLTSEDTTSIDEGAYTAKVILEYDGSYYKKARGVFNLVKDCSSVEVTM